MTPVQGSDRSENLLWNPAKGLDMSCKLEEMGGPDMSGLEARHVRSRGQTCPANVSGTRSGRLDMSGFCWEVGLEI
jgi:hypothetical protein